MGDREEREESREAETPGCAAAPGSRRCRSSARTGTRCAHLPPCMPSPAERFPWPPHPADPRSLGGLCFLLAGGEGARRCAGQRRPGPPGRLLPRLYGHPQPACLVSRAQRLVAQRAHTRLQRGVRNASARQRSSGSRAACRVADCSPRLLPRCCAPAPGATESGTSTECSARCATFPLNGAVLGRVGAGGAGEVSPAAD